MIEVPDFLEELIAAGIDVTISHNKAGIYFDLNLQAKSHMHLYKRDGRWFVGMRYDEEFEVTGIDDLRSLAQHGKHGRDYISTFWAEFLMDPEARAKQQLARNALDRLTPDERDAVAEYLK